MDLINPGVQNGCEAGPNEWKVIGQVDGAAVARKSRTAEKKIEDRQVQAEENADLKQCEGGSGAKAPDTVPTQIRKILSKIARVGAAVGVVVSIPVVKEAIFSGLLWLSGAGITRQMASYGVSD